MDANKLLIKILDQGLKAMIALDLYNKIRDGEVTLDDIVRLKELLGLTDLEAIDIFLS